MKRDTTGKDSFLYFICEQAKALQCYSYNTVNPEGTPIVFYPQNHMLLPPGLSCFPGGRGWFR